MHKLKILYRDVDRTPYLFLLRRCAVRHGLEIELLSASARDAEWSERLEREEVDVISDNYWRLQVGRARGVPYVAIATASNVYPEQLFEPIRQRRCGGGIVLRERSGQAGAGAERAHACCLTRTG